MSDHDPAELAEIKKNKVVDAYVQLAKAYRNVTEALVDFYQGMADPQQGYHILDFASLEEVMIAGELFSQTLLGKRQHPIGSQDAQAGQGKKRKRERDPNAPKRPASAFIEFQNDVRQQYRDQNPDLQYKDVMALISSAWTALPEEEKRKYQEITAAKTTEFEKAKKIYEQGHGGASNDDNQGEDYASDEEQAPDSVKGDSDAESKKTKYGSGNKQVKDSN